MDMEGRKTTPAFELEIDIIEHIASEITEIMPNRVAEWPQPRNARKQIRRMREPYHSIYLIWLARLSLADLIFSDGIVVDKHRGLIIEPDRSNT